MAYRLNETRDELHIHIYILADKKNCSLRGTFEYLQLMFQLKPLKCVAKILAL